MGNQLKTHYYNIQVHHDCICKIYLIEVCH